MKFPVPVVSIYQSIRSLKISRKKEKGKIRKSIEEPQRYLPEVTKQIHYTYLKWRWNPSIEYSN